MDQSLFDHRFILGIAFSILCGSIIGIERQVRGKPVGIRTSILICLGTMLFIYLGNHIEEGKDVARILGQVVTGIGFLGAGVIMNKEGPVSGVTSAAVVWLLAGIGASVGFGYYQVAVVVSCTALFVLVGVEYLENIFKSLRRGVHSHGKNE